LKTQDSDYNATIDNILKFIDETHLHMVPTKSIQVCVVNIKGILYYVDTFQNVYKTEDILEHRNNPRVIGKGIISSSSSTCPTVGVDDASETTHGN